MKVKRMTHIQFNELCTYMRKNQGTLGDRHVIAAEAQAKLGFYVGCSSVTEAARAEGIKLKPKKYERSVKPATTATPLFSVDIILLRSHVNVLNELGMFVHPELARLAGPKAAQDAKNKVA